MTGFGEKKWEKTLYPPPPPGMEEGGDNRLKISQQHPPPGREVHRAGKNLYCIDLFPTN